MMSKDIRVNGEPMQFLGDTIHDVILSVNPKQPFAVAVNTVFVPKQQYVQTQLNQGDVIDIVNPVVGG